MTHPNDSKGPKSSINPKNPIIIKIGSDNNSTCQSMTGLTQVINCQYMHTSFVFSTFAQVLYNDFSLHTRIVARVISPI